MIRLRRSATLCAIFLLAILLNLQVVEAGRLWCKADPVVTLDGRVVSISLAIPVDSLLMVDGPTRIEIRTPATVERYVVVNDVGFLRGSVVVFTDSDEKVVDAEYTEVKDRK